MCSDNATCANTMGSCARLCKSGYAGDGFNCSGNVSGFYKILTLLWNLSQRTSSGLCQMSNVNVSRKKHAYILCGCNAAFTGDGFARSV